MAGIADIFGTALGLIASGDAALWAIVALSLKVTLAAVAIACLIGFPLGVLIGGFRFTGRSVLYVLFTALMGLPPVVVGLSVYLLLSASGPFGVLHWLYTPWAMILAQTVLVTPIIAALTAQVVEDLNLEYAELFQSFGVTGASKAKSLLWDARFSLFTVALAGFGRAMAEVGAVMIVGGNINHATRVMTTAIALETSRGNLVLALALGVILLILALAVNAAVFGLRSSAQKARYV